jgi:hypothetical protein
MRELTSEQRNRRKQATDSLRKERGPRGPYGMNDMTDVEFSMMQEARE